MDVVNLSKIFQTSTSFFPNHKGDLSIPSVSYRYSKTIRSNVTNYKTASDPNIQTPSCKCSMYPSKYLDPHHQHIVTGDLTIVKDEQLRRLLNMGLNYREKNKPDKDKSLAAFQSALDRYINKVSSRLNLPTVMFKQWKVEILSKVRLELTSLPTYNFNRILGKKQIRDKLEKLQSEFIFAPIDKASCNVSLICRFYYTQVLEHELKHSGNFAEVHRTESDIVENISEYLKSKKLLGTLNASKLPFLYWTSKQHKDPIGSRFITSGKHTVASKMSQTIGCIMKTLLKSDKNTYQYKNTYME